MAEAVVDPLETVQVEEDDGVRLGLAAFGRRQAVGQLAVEQRAIRQARQRIVGGVETQARFRLALPADVQDGAGGVANAIDLDRQHVDAHVNALAVAMQEDRLVLARDIAGFAQVRVHLGGLGQDFGRQQVGIRPADEFRLGVADHARQRPVDVIEPAAARQIDADAAVLDQGAVAALRTLQGLAHAVLLVHVQG